MEAYLNEAIRTPRGNGKKTGSLAQVSHLELTTNLLKALKESNNLNTSMSGGLKEHLEKAGNNRIFYIN
jgi:acetyl-CoA C-acetyltransferase